jgi:hypothetical protein
MSPTSSLARKALILTPGQGRPYSMGRMRAVFMADNAETDSHYSISEWWLEPNTRGPGVHAHPDDHVGLQRILWVMPALRTLSAALLSNNSGQ